MSKNEVGTVEKYIEQKGFGFLKTDSGLNIFFHINDWRKISLDDSDEIQISFGRLEREPKVGDILCCSVISESKGYRAKSWYFKDELDKIVSSITTKPHYRVLEQFGGPLHDNVKQAPNILWQGTKLKALSEKYPRRKSRNDSTLVYFSHDDGFTISYSFEESRDNGVTWHPCEDPREIETGRRRRYY